MAVAKATSKARRPSSHERPSEAELAEKAAQDQRLAEACVELLRSRHPTGLSTREISEQLPSQLQPFFKTSSILSTKLNSFFRRFYDAEGVPLMYNSPVLCPLTRYVSELPPKRLVYRFVGEDERDAVFSARSAAATATATASGAIAGAASTPATNIPVTSSVGPEEEIQMLTPPAEDSDFATSSSAPSGSSSADHRHHSRAEASTPKYNLRETIKRTPHAFSPRRSGRLEGQPAGESSPPASGPLAAAAVAGSRLPAPLKAPAPAPRVYSGPNPYYDKWIVPCTVDTCDPWSSDATMEIDAPEDTELDDLIPL